MSVFHNSRANDVGILLISMSLTGLVVGCDDDTPPGEVEVEYNGQRTTIDLEDLEIITLDDGEEYARLSDVVDAAELGVNLDALEFDFEGADGFRSSTTSTCVDHIPLPGSFLDQGYIHRITRDMAWDEDLDMPGCTHVDNLALLLASDASGTRAEIDIVYGETTETVDLTTLDVVDFEGEDHVRLSDVVDAAGLSTATTDLAFDFEASDGFRPSNSGNCTDVVPISGDQLGDGYISLTARNLLWDDSADLPGCMNLDDVVIIEATDL